MRNFKKVLAIVLCLIMSMSAMTLFVSADTTPTAKTVYIASTGLDTNDGLSNATPVATLKQAFAILGTAGGEIVVLDDVTELTMNYSDYSSGGARISRFGDEVFAPVYIHGVKKSGSEDYTSIKFDTTGDPKKDGVGRQIVHVVFNGPVEIDDIELKINMETFFFSTLGYEFTIGENVKTTALTTATDKTGKFNICGGKQNTGIGGTLNVSSPAVTNIYAGTWDRIFSVSVNPGADTEQRAGTVNIYGGTITTVYTKQNHTNVAVIDGNLTVNYYGGTVETIAGYGVAKHTVNLYGTTKAASGITFTEQFADGGTGVINESIVIGQAPAFAKTVYMSSTGKDTNDGLTEATAVATIEKATEILGAKGGEVIVLDDMIQDISSYEVLASGNRISLEETTSTVYIHGKQKADKTYPSLQFKTAVNNPDKGTYYAAIIEFAGPVAIYDLGFGVSTKGNMWISTNAYPFSVGQNVSTVMGGGVANICGGQQDNKVSGLLNTNPELPSVINIYSGDWSQVYATSFNKGSVQAKDATVNFMGGSINTLYTVRKDAIPTGTLTINYYGGTIGTSIAGYNAENRTNILNLYNGVMETTDAKLIDVFAADGGGTVAAKSGDAPEFFTASMFDVTPIAPPTFEEDPDQGNTGNDNSTSNKNEETTKAPQTTKAPETTAAAEEGGCGSVIGMSAVALVAVMGTALAIGKKKED